MDDTCKKREGGATEHCWHKTGRVLATDVPAEEEKCCWCGATRHIDRKTAPVEGHGLYYSEKA